MIAVGVLLGLAAVWVVVIRGFVMRRPITELDRRLTAIDEAAAPTPVQHARHRRAS